MILNLEKDDVLLIYAVLHRRLLDVESILKQIKDKTMRTIYENDKQRLMLLINQLETEK